MNSKHVLKYIISELSEQYLCVLISKGYNNRALQNNINFRRKRRFPCAKLKSFIAMSQKLFIFLSFKVSEVIIFK